MAEPRTAAAGNVENLKVPPHSVEAEQSVLGGLMLNNRAMDDIVDRVSAGDFYRHDHRLLFTVLGELHERDQPFDVVTVSEALARKHLLEEVGGLAYLAELASNTPSAANIGAYAEIVRERSVMRQLIRVANEIADDAFNPSGRTVPQLLDEAETRVFRIAEGRQRGSGPAALKDIAPAVVDAIKERAANPGTVTGIPTGFDRLDNMTSGLHKGDLVIVAGRPSMGKTTFAMNIAENAMLKTGKPVLVFSMEMPSDQIVLRMISSFGRIDQTRLRNGKLEPEDWDRLVSAFGVLRDQKLFVDDTPALSPTELRARARRVAREAGGLGLIVVDYLQLMQVPGNNENRATEISAISRSLKAVAKELSVPVIALSQLNRSLEQRPDKRPVMSDLRESGAIEQDADIIMFVFREEVYLQKDADGKAKERLEKVRGTAEIIIGKQRNGPIGKVGLAFLGQFTRFENLALEDYGDYGE